MASEINIPKGSTVKSIKIKIKFSKAELVKSLSECGQRESALCLQNWDILDSSAEQFLKSREAELEKAIPKIPPVIKDVAKDAAVSVASAYLKNKLKMSKSTDIELEKVFRPSVVPGTLAGGGNNKPENFETPMEYRDHSGALPVGHPHRPLAVAHELKLVNAGRRGEADAHRRRYLDPTHQVKNKYV
jgi:hypothetical protein